MSNEFSLTSEAGRGSGPNNPEGEKNAPPEGHTDDLLRLPSLSGPNEINKNAALVSFSRSFRIICVTLVLGAAAGSAFMGLGFNAARKEDSQAFAHEADESIREVQDAIKEYEAAALWIHSICRYRNITRQGFRELYLHLKRADFSSAGFILNVTHQERASMEEESRQFLAEKKPNMTYSGFHWFGETSPDADYYFPLHYTEPIEANAVFLDMNVEPFPIVHEVLRTWKPAVTSGFKISPGTYRVIFYHPGIPLVTQPDLIPHDVATIEIVISALLERAARKQGYPVRLYLYDSLGGSEMALGDIDENYFFLGGIDEYKETEDGSIKLEFSLERNFSSFEGHRIQTRDAPIGNRLWTVVYVAEDTPFGQYQLFVIIGGVTIFVATISLALWMHNNSYRNVKIEQMKSAAEREKSALLVEKARNVQKLNDFIAHECRNPLAAAISASTFVSSALTTTSAGPSSLASTTEAAPLLLDAEALRSVQDDMAIIDTSLHYINDLLRTMLDMYRVSSGQIAFSKAPTDVLRDIFEPTSAMIYERDQNFNVVLECPEDLTVRVDCLRLKQVLLNLSRNSKDFVLQGFIRLRAEICATGNVQLSVEDSGPGIPKEKRDSLFEKYQESLEILQQGTGVGLYLCKKLADSMNISLWLDESYDSGIPNCPGTRFVLDIGEGPVPPGSLQLNCSPETQGSTSQPSVAASRSSKSDISDKSPQIDQCKDPAEDAVLLPEALRVLIVDDDMIVRKMFKRSVQKVAPSWSLWEAASGEAALRLVEEEEQQFDLIFMDQYMASTEKALLGTETVRFMVAKGVTARICGLSANEMEDQFLLAGAHVFVMKPFPVKPTALKNELIRILGLNGAV